MLPSTSAIGPSTSHAPAAPPISTSFAADLHLWSVLDPEIARENPVEDKHRRLVRSHRSSPYDRELKPNAKIRDELGVSGSNFTDVTLLTWNVIGNTELCSQSASKFRRERSNLEIPLLPRAR